MATFNVTKVRKSPSNSGGAHEHIIGVITEGGTYYANQQVIDSIAVGNTWQTSVAGEPKARIKKDNYCPQSGCYHGPYLTTAPDHSKKNNLENLPRG